MRGVGPRRLRRNKKRGLEERRTEEEELREQKKGKGRGGAPPCEQRGVLSSISPIQN